MLNAFHPKDILKELSWSCWVQFLFVIFQHVLVQAHTSLKEIF